MKKILLSLAVVSVITLATIYFAKKGASRNASACFAELVIAHKSSNPGKVLRGRDLGPIIKETGLCAEKRNNFIENFFFDVNDAGNHIHITTFRQK